MAGRSVFTSERALALGFGGDAGVRRLVAAFLRAEPTAAMSEHAQLPGLHHRRRLVRRCGREGAAGDAACPSRASRSARDIGGMWRYENDNGLSSAYRSLHIDTSRKNLGYPDFPIPDALPGLPVARAK